MDVNNTSLGGIMRLKEKYAGSTPTVAEYFEKNGVDADLLEKSRKYHTLEGYREFFKEFTEDDLDKLTFIDVGGKKMVGTWRQAKDLYMTRLALHDRARELVNSMADVNDKSDPAYAEYKNVGRLATAVTRNLDHALALAKTYLHGLREPKDSITLSADALKKLFDDARAAPPERPEPGTA